MHRLQTWKRERRRASSWSRSMAMRGRTAECRRRRAVQRTPHLCLTSTWLTGMARTRSAWRRMTGMSSSVACAKQRPGRPPERPLRFVFLLQCLRSVLLCLESSLVVWIASAEHRRWRAPFRAHARGSSGVFCKGLRIAIPCWPKCWSWKAKPAAITDKMIDVM